MAETVARPRYLVAGTNRVHIMVLADPLGAEATADHLALDHQVPRHVLSAHTPAEHTAWHEAEHRTRDPKPDAKQARHAGHLTHTHTIPEATP